MALTQNLDRKVPADEPQQATVCQILENLRMYDGKVVAIRVVNLNLQGTQCQPPTATDDPRLLNSGKALLNEVYVAPFTYAAMEGPLGKALSTYDRWLRDGYDTEMR